MEEIKFGPSCNEECFYADGNTSTKEAPAWLKTKGLNAYEYSFGKGYRMSTKTAEEIGEQAKKHGILMSVHAPYYVNFANPDDEMAEKSYGYVLTGLKMLRAFGGKHLVVHIGTETKQDRNTALNLINRRLDELVKRVYLEGYSDLKICPETMGKFAQIGTYKEIVDFCTKDEIFVPTFDFGHIYALNRGNFGSVEDYLEVFNYSIEKLGHERTKNCHIHFSKIQYSDKGEVRHLNYTDEGYGPSFENLAKAIKMLKLTPTIICESAGHMATDALEFKKIYENI